MVSINNSQDVSLYRIGGTLAPDEETYVTRAGDKELYLGLKAGDFCYVLNSRQMGKSSLAMRVQQELESSGFITAYIDLQDIARTEEEKWYNGIIHELADELSCEVSIDWKNWLDSVTKLSPVQKLSHFLEKVVLESRTLQEAGLVIFIDEIDYVRTLDFSTDSFFTLIRSCYNARARKPKYNALTFSLLGVATPSDLIDEKHITPFNIGTAITLKGFTINEVNPLIKGLTHLVNKPKKVMEEILYWTGGQPFLTQRLCDLVVNQKQQTPDLTEIVQRNIIDNWDDPEQDKQEHLRTIRNRILSDERRASLLLELYRKILKKGQVPVINTKEERDLQLSGLVVKKGNILKVYNPIYEKVFNETWIDIELGKLRPYAENYRAWVLSGKQDESRLLRGQALVEAEKWANGKNIGGEDRDFLGASRAKERAEEIERKDKEANLERERKAREAAEEVQQILEKANQEGKKRLRRRTLVGTVVLTVAFMAAGILAIVAKEQVQIADQANKITEKVQQEAKLAKQEAVDADERVKILNQELNSKQASLQSIQENLTKAEKEAAQKLKQATQAQEKAQLATQSAQQAQQTAQKAWQELEAVKQARNELERKAQELEQKAQEASKRAEQAQELAKKAINDLKKAQSDKLKAQEALQKAEEKLSNTEVALANAEEALLAVRGLTQLAGRLKKEGIEKASDEALKKASLSTLIENEELKQAWLLAATAEGYLSLAQHNNTRSPEQQQVRKKAQEEAQKAIQDSKTALSKEIKGGISQQVKAFSYFIAGQLNDHNSQAYQTAYKSLKESQFNPFNPNVEVDILTERDVENIHYQLIKSRNIDINSQTDPIAKSFRQHLYNELNFLLQEDRLREADQTTWKIMLYVAQREQDGWLDIKSLENFSCAALREIDELWYNYPGLREHFGFRIQKKIWQKNGSPDDSSPTSKWRQIYIELGWKEKDSGIESSIGYIEYGDLAAFNDRELNQIPRGHLPWSLMRESFGWGGTMADILGPGVFYYRISACEL